jgi:DNA-binding Lrp family transcriptional regulator
MVFAYILCTIETDDEETLLRTLLDCPDVRRVSLTYGIYDICVEAQVNTLEELDHLVFDDIRKIPGITKTSTIITSRMISHELN